MLTTIWRESTLRLMVITLLLQRSASGHHLPHASLNSMAQSCHSDERGAELSSTLRTTALARDLGAQIETGLIQCSLVVVYLHNHALQFEGLP
jgi:hypothetical protein